MTSINLTPEQLSDIIAQAVAQAMKTPASEPEVKTPAKPADSDPMQQRAKLLEKYPLAIGTLPRRAGWSEGWASWEPTPKRDEKTGKERERAFCALYECTAVGALASANERVENICELLGAQGHDISIGMTPKSTTQGITWEVKIWVFTTQKTIRRKNYAAKA